MDVLPRPIRLYYMYVCGRMEQDAESGYGNAELSSIRVEPNEAIFYPYQMPVPVGPMPIYGTSGGVIRIVSQ